MQKRHLSVREYATAYGVSMNTVYAMCAAGRLAHIRLGMGRGTIRILEDAVPECGDEDGRTDAPVRTEDRRG